ncbi:MAG: chorismate synthase, partial [Burkholderiales bacterium]|nr:chorismate synthase [Anaerolineae bacterium]
PIVARTAMTPISTIVQGMESVDLATGQPDKTTYELSDYCALSRAVPIGEAMMALVITDALLEKLGGDSVGEMLPRFASLRTAKLEDLPMDNVEWRFGYP